MLYFKQFLAGEEYARDNQTAAAMANFSYAIGCDTTHECYLIDPAWSPEELLALIEADGYTLKGVIATHYHFDHIGGSAYRIDVSGAMELLALKKIPLICHSLEKSWIEKSVQISPDRIQTVAHGDTLTIGDTSIEIVHTPGHSPGGMCLMFNGKLIVGDTLFHEGCGRTDIPGGDMSTLFKTLAERIAPLSPTLRVYCGHNYGTHPSMLLGDILRSNYIFGNR